MNDPKPTSKPVNGGRLARQGMDLSRKTLNTHIKKIKKELKHEKTKPNLYMEEFIYHFSQKLEKTTKKKNH